MDTQRLFIFAGLFLVSLILWQEWVAFNNPTQPATTATTTAQQTDANSDIPTAPQEKSAQPGDIPAVAQEQTGSQKIRVKTDVFDLLIDTEGGDIRQAKLPTYPVSLEKDAAPVTLLTESPGNFFVAQSGVLARNANQSQYAPNHQSIYSAEKAEYELTGDELRVPLTWRSEDGQFEVVKTYIFKKGSFDITVEHQFNNKLGETWQGHIYRQLKRAPGTQASTFIYTYTGAMYSREGDGFAKVDFDDMEDEKLSFNNTGGWVSIIQHYFMAAWIPPQNSQEHYYTKAVDVDTAYPRYIIGTTGPAVTVASGATETFTDQLFVGPKLQEQLTEVAEGLDNTVDYGFLSIIGHPLYWILEKFHDLFNNWGWAIIFLTILIKLAFFKLSAASYKSMAHMRKVAPRLKAIQEMHADNPQAKNQALMELYKTEKINPLGGCLPILVQIPVFIALYWVLLESVEMRQADFMLWINDLSSKDPYFILPILMGVTMFVQQKLNPAPMDPVQAKILMVLPFVFTIFFAFFPAGLVLYWFVNNLLSIAQQWYITRKIESGEMK